MLATLNRSIVTDFHPIRNQPVGLFVVFVLFAVAAVTRDVVPALVVVAAVGLGVVAGWVAGLWSGAAAGHDADDFAAP